MEKDLEEGGRRREFSSIVHLPLEKRRTSSKKGGEKGVGGEDATPPSPTKGVKKEKREISKHNNVDYENKILLLSFTFTV